MKQNIILGITALLFLIIIISGCTQKLEVPTEPTSQYINETEAIQIAKNAGLEEGITNWETSFHWFAGDLNTYVWTVQNTLSVTPSQEPEATGKTVVIDANSGEVKMISEWQKQS